MNEARFYQQLEKNTVRCELCNHFCTITDGKTGICRVRQNKNGKLSSLVYGYPAALNIDPIEKKPLFHFLPASQTYSLGTYGCNFACANCQNWDISQAKNIETQVSQLDYIEPERIVESAIAEECQSISYTYNEPTIFTEYALAIMKLSHASDLKNVWVSNGFMSGQCLDAVIPYLDAINVDLKSFDDNFYKNNCQARVQPILDNLKRLKQEQVHVEITTLIIPTLSDDRDMLKQIADFIVNELDAETPWHLSKFSPSISWKLKKIPSTTDDIIYDTYEIGKQAGLKYVYVGNIPGDQKENTYCPHCGELAIRRMGYDIERSDLNGRCSYCDSSLDIVE